MNAVIGAGLTSPRAEADAAAASSSATGSASAAESAAESADPKLAAIPQLGLTLIAPAGAVCDDNGC